jgi:hypothetical protein
MMSKLSLTLSSGPISASATTGISRTCADAEDFITDVPVGRVADMPIRDTPNVA